MTAFQSTHFSLGTYLKFLSIASIGVLIVWYVHFQARNFIQGPEIVLSGSYEALQHERRIAIEGNAQNIVKLTVNGKEIHTNKRGDFSHELVLENGYTIMSIDAQDRFGRRTSLVREYVYVPESGLENGV